jgi:Na+/melibiose symporter-like transporter
MELTTLIQAVGAISVLNTLTVEAIKKIFDKAGITFPSTLLAAITAVILSIVASAMYVIYYSIAVTPRLIVAVIMVVYLSFLCSTVTFDKVKDALEKIGG